MAAEAASGKAAVAADTLGRLFRTQRDIGTLAPIRLRGD
jgi:hypothetical protein